MLSTDIEITFTESDYSASEADGVMVVRLQTSGRRATPVTVRVTPINYDEYLDLGNALPSGFVVLDPSNDGPVVPPDGIKSPNRANSAAFDCELSPCQLLSLK